MLSVIAESIIKSAIFEEKRLFTVIEPEIKNAIFKFQRSDIIKVQQQIGYGLKCIFSTKLNILKINLKIVETFCCNTDIRWVYIKIFLHHWGFKGILDFKPVKPIIKSFVVGIGNFFFKTSKSIRCRLFYIQIKNSCEDW